jgi:hypothetical protein
MPDLGASFHSLNLTPSEQHAAARCQPLRPIQYGPPPLRPGYRWETQRERDARHAHLDARERKQH